MHLQATFWNLRSAACCHNSNLVTLPLLRKYDTVSCFFKIGITCSCAMPSSSLVNLRKHKIRINYCLHSSRGLFSTGPHLLIRCVLQTVQSSASCFNFQYPLVSLKSSSSCLFIVPLLPITSIPPPIFTSKMCFKRQFLARCDSTS